MILIFEGMDNCLKDTIILKIRKHLSAKTHVLKYSGPPKIQETEEYQKEHFKDMFHFLMECSLDSNRNLILNRAHLGEFVYGPIYRREESSWIFDLENEFVPKLENYTKTALVLLFDSNDGALLAREDGKSLSANKNVNLGLERERFQEAFERSLFKNKAKFDLSDYPGKQGKVDDDKIVEIILNLLK